VPGLSAILVGGTRPQVDDCFAADLDTQPGTTLLRVIEQCGECFTYRFELERVMTLNLHLSRLGKHRKNWPTLFQSLCDL
jgi:hypothetical protein